jgi:hypothetical protein
LASAQESVPYFTTANTDGMFRVPKVKSYVRGTDNPAVVGNWLNDQMQQFDTQVAQTGGSTNAQLSNGTGISGWNNSASGYTKTDKNGRQLVQLVAGSQGAPRFGSETRGKTIYLLPCIQAFGPTAYASQTAYEAYKSIPGNEQKTLEDFFESLSAYGVARDVTNYTGTPTQ